MERVNLDEIYTNLSLIDQSDPLKITPITYEDLFTNDGSLNLSRRLLFQGEGGVGKTTLCSKIAWDWCQGRILKDLDMVLVIPLRDVTDGKSIGGIVQKYFSDMNPATQDQIDRYILKNLNRIVIVFDGFDEFSGKLEERSSSEVIRILGLEQYQSCKVIVTTRPWRKHEFTVVKSLAEAYTFIKVDGFNEDNLRMYIKKYFRTREKDALAESLITFMEENDVIQSNMAPFPIYCAMLCLMWEEFSEERRMEMTKMQTFSEIFGEMISFLEEHYASKACQNFENQNAVWHLKEAGRAIQDISEIALNGVLQNNMTFPEDRFRECRDAMETCCRVGVLTIERDVIKRRRRRNVNIQSFVSSTVSFPHKLFQEYIGRVYIENVYTDNRAEYNQLKNKLLAQFEQFRYLLYFISTLRDEIRLDIISGLTRCAHQYFCVDVAFECHTEEAAKAVGERWDEYKLSPDMSEHTKSGVVFMVRCNQVRSLRIDRLNCGRTLLLDLAEGMCSSCVLRKVTVDLFNSTFQTDFYKVVADKASICQIQDLALTISYWNDNLQYQSSMGKELARWVCTMQSISNFSVRCHNLPSGFFSTAAEMAKSCQVCELSMVIDSGRISESEATAAAEFLCHIPHLRCARITCDEIPRTFFTTIDSQTTTCKEQLIEGITINEKPLTQLLSDKHESTTKQDDFINIADGTGFPSLELATMHDHSTVTEAVVDHDADLKISSESRRTDFYTAVRLDDD
ncbi:uncharacterized protein [Diadema setosum]|uniref:uncharacterized protein n=1 Tax=Diadema setosum TaxID=31175 RepID=UPI003B3A90BF